MIPLMLIIIKIIMRLMILMLMIIQIIWKRSLIGVMGKKTCGDGDVQATAYCARDTCAIHSLSARAPATTMSIAARNPINQLLIIIFPKNGRSK